jgi:glycosyltransferase involved in cell wall biosynthesis
VQLPPDAALTGEGIFRLLGLLLRAIAARGDTRVVVATARWTAKDLFAALEREGVDTRALELLLPGRREPLVVRMRRSALRRAATVRPRRRPWLEGLAGRVARWQPLRRLARRAAATESPLAAVLLAAAAGVAALLAAPPLALGWVARSLGPAGATGRLAAWLRARGQALTTGWRLPAIGSTLYELAARAHKVAVDHEFERLAARANARADVEAWLVPHPAASAAALIGRPLVVSLPDLVYDDFPTAYDWRIVADVDERIRTVVARADAVVCFSEHVRRHHAAGRLGVALERTRVIRHAPIPADPELARVASLHGGDRRAAALAVLRSYFKTPAGQAANPAAAPSGYLAELPFDEVDFLFVSSQLRAHKNNLILVRSFASLLRRSYRPLKLFFTGRLAEDRWGVGQLIAGEHLDLDVISVPDLPGDVHSAFYTLAALTVVPTLFEGGFPFPCDESLMHGTPVVMSDIPVAREMVPDDLVGDMLFDPYDAVSMASRIGWALDHRQELLKRQLAWLAQRQRSWDDVAGEYLGVLGAAGRRRQEPTA